MLSDKEKTELRAQNASVKSTSIDEQCHRIHRAVNDGTLDRGTVDDALARIAELNSTAKVAPDRPAQAPSPGFNPNPGPGFNQPANSGQ